MQADVKAARPTSTAMLRCLPHTRVVWKESDGKAAQPCLKAKVRAQGALLRGCCCSQRTLCLLVTGQQDGSARCGRVAAAMGRCE